MVIYLFWQLTAVKRRTREENIGDNLRDHFFQHGAAARPCRAGVGSRRCRRVRRRWCGGGAGRVGKARSDVPTIAQHARKRGGGHGASRLCPPYFFDDHYNILGNAISLGTPHVAHTLLSPALLVLLEGFDRAV